MSEHTTALPLLTLEDLADRAVLTVEEVASLLGLGRSAAYEAARRGQIPTRRLGRRIVVPVPALLAWLGVADATTAA
jgi:excisionase family DNA binding protein